MLLAILVRSTREGLEAGRAILLGPLPLREQVEVLVEEAVLEILQEVVNKEDSNNSRSSHNNHNRSRSNNSNNHNSSRSNNSNNHNSSNSNNHNKRNSNHNNKRNRN